MQRTFHHRGEQLPGSANALQLVLHININTKRASETLLMFVTGRRQAQAAHPWRRSRASGRTSGPGA